MDALAEIRSHISRNHNQVAYVGQERSGFTAALHVWPDRVGTVTFTRVHDATRFTDTRQAICATHSEPVLEMKCLPDARGVDAFVLSVETLPHAADCITKVGYIDLDPLRVGAWVTVEPVGAPLDA